MIDLQRIFFIYGHNSRGRSVPDDQHLAQYVKEVLDDKDGYEGIAFTRFLADCNGKGIPIIWENMI